MRFGTTPRRREILAGFFAFRSSLHEAGVEVGLQWINGSFVENEVQRPRDDGKEHPQDLDVVTLWCLPQDWLEGISNWAEVYKQEKAFTDQHAALFDRPRIKEEKKVDSLWISLCQESHILVEHVAYWHGLWSHTKAGADEEQSIWKGYVQVDLAKGEDEAAIKVLRSLSGND